MPRALLALTAALALLLAAASAGDAARPKHRKAKVHRVAGASLQKPAARTWRTGYRPLISWYAPSLPAATAPAPVAAPPAVPAPDPLGSFASVRASDSATNFSFSLSRPAVAAGTVRLQLQNRGEDPHDLTVAPEAGGAPLASTGSVAPGQSPTLPVDLPAGRYKLYCSLFNHAQRGMQATLEVR